MQESSFDPLFVAVDANFRLCRRKRAGHALGKVSPLIQPSFFLSQEEVDAYILSEQKIITHSTEVGFYTVYMYI